MKRSLNLLFGSVLMLGASPAFAQNPNFIDTTRTVPTAISGSDTLNKVMDDLIVGLTGAGQLSGGVTTYLGCGSSCGERQVAGSPTAADGVNNGCTPSDGNGAPEANPGCQEISPMSRELQNGICDDDPNFPSTSNDQAEGLAFCADGLVILGANDSIGAFGQDAAACSTFHSSTTTPNTGNTFNSTGVGQLRKSGVLASGYAIADWKDVVRLVYTGCKNTDGLCANNNDRVVRCDSAVRKEVVSNWGNLFEGVACPQSTGCPTGLRQAYRRDDKSGTTGVFLALIGVAADVNKNLLSRTAFIGGVPVKVQDLPANSAFCDGGEVEGLLPSHIGPATAAFPSGEPLFTNADPIRTNCAAEDDLCGPDGKLALVRPIRSTDASVPNPYPTHQCKRLFEYKTYLSTALPVCPDRTKPSAGRCKFPYFESAGFKTFNCMNSARQTNPLAVPGSDGRAYNFLVHQQDGTVEYQDGAAKKMPVVAQWRQNMVKLDNSALANGKAFAAADYVCTESDATRNIGCLTANSKCTLGWAGREAAFNNGQPTVHLANEPVLLNGFTPSNANIGAEVYPFARNLFVNATRGFENIMVDCKNRGGSKAYCEDQRRIAQEFFNMGQPGNLLPQICSNAGYIPLDAAVCKGATASAACGAPTIQPLSACGIDTASYDSLANN